MGHPPDQFLALLRTGMNNFVSEIMFYDQANRQNVGLRLAFLTHVIREQTGSVVQHGILKGYAVPPGVWAEYISGAYILGIYEVAVCALLDHLRKTRRSFVDVGAADGLYGIGLVATGAFDRSFCFELDRDQLDRLAARADALGIAQRVNFAGEANANLAATLADAGFELDDTVILCDIEGAEFHLFDEALLHSLSAAHVIIELHEWVAGPAESTNALEGLIRRAGKHFHVRIIDDGLRDMRGLTMLRGWSDWDTWLLCAEGRGRLMSWLWLAPLDEVPLGAGEIDALVLEYQRSFR
jgi:hypothetical protein